MLPVSLKTRIKGVGKKRTNGLDKKEMSLAKFLSIF